MCRNVKASLGSNWWENRSIYSLFSCSPQRTLEGQMEGEAAEDGERRMEKERRGPEGEMLIVQIDEEGFPEVSA